MNQDALVGPQVAEVEQHHVGGDVVDGEGGRLLEAHALWDVEGVVGRRHHHLLPQPEAAQHHHLVADLPVGEEGKRETQCERSRKTENSSETQTSCFFAFCLFGFHRQQQAFLETLGTPPPPTHNPPRPAETRTVCSQGAASKHRERWSDAAALVTVATSARETTKDHRNDPVAPLSSIFTSKTLHITIPEVSF